ncbi:MAG: glycine cleavage system protein GcvH [Planctomycetes bacterium]|nr:glycine cleavage system protein GcvH [Planctomycetota bacterium]
MRPDDRKYMKSHEWAKTEGEFALVGISDYAVEHLSDLVFLDLPEVGSTVSADEPFGEIESVKAVSDLYAPVSGEIVEINQDLPDDLDTLKTDPWNAGWMIKVKLTGESPNLMGAAAYEEHLKSEE